MDDLTKRRRKEKEESSTNFVYILQCRDGTLYTGWTNDIEQRIRAHNSGKGAKYTKGRGPVKLVHLENFPTKEEAMRREWAVKHMKKEKKLELIRGERKC